MEADISTASAQQLQQSLAGCDALVIATSAVPQLKPLSLVKVFWAKITGQEGVRPEFGWKGNQLPEQVGSRLSMKDKQLGMSVSGAWL